MLTQTQSAVSRLTICTVIEVHVQSELNYIINFLIKSTQHSFFLMILFSFTLRLNETAC